MRPIALACVQPGMVLARTIHSLEGRVLLAAGQPLTAQYLATLTTLGVATIFIEEPHTEDIIIGDIIDEGTRFAGIRLVGRVLRELEEAPDPTAYNLPTVALKQVANDIVYQLLQRRSLTVSNLDLKNLENYTAAHSVNTAVLSTLIGIKAGMVSNQLYDLCLGALLHDLGKSRIPDAVMNKPGKLTKDEFEVMKRHSEEGYRIVSAHRDIPVPAAIVSLQHHEKCNAKGYPRGLAGDRIYEFSKIVAVTDVFDALSSDRVYKRRMLPDRAFKVIQGADATHFDARYVTVFAANVATYPTGTLVELGSGERGIVIAPGARDLHQPKVRILRDAQGRVIPRPFELDLSEFTTYRVVNILDNL